MARVLCITTDSEERKIEDLVNSLPDVAVEMAHCGYEAIDILRSSAFDALLACFPMPDWSAEEFLEQTQRVNSLIPVLIRDRNAALSDAVRLTKLGAWHYFGASVDREELAGLIQSAAEHLDDRKVVLYGAERREDSWRNSLVGESKAMEKVFRVVRLIGARRSTVLISGETGTGKEMVARAIHMASPRSHLPMVAVNCSALPENLLEAELFGHVKGAFTGAISNRVGRFEQAHRSTIFLDEVGDMPLDLQAKLLRVLQEREFQRLGSSETIKVDVRVLAASNVCLMERIREGRFREDLFYRLNVVPLSLPPLKDRSRDIPILVEHFIQKICQQEGLPLRQVTPETVARLARYDWPGNVRQLENAVEMAIALSGDRQVLFPGDFPMPSITRPESVASTAPHIAVPDDGLDFEQTVERIERAILEQAMRKTGGNKKQAADMLRLKRTTFSAKLKSLGAGAATALTSRVQACAAG